MENLPSPTVRRYLSEIGDIANTPTHTFYTHARKLQWELTDPQCTVAEHITPLYHKPSTPFESYLRQRVVKPQR